VTNNEGRASVISTVSFIASRRATPFQCHPMSGYHWHSGWNLFRPQLLNARAVTKGKRVSVRSGILDAPRRAGESFSSAPRESRIGRLYTGANLRHLKRSNCRILNTNGENVPGSLRTNYWLPFSNKNCPLIPSAIILKLDSTLSGLTLVSRPTTRRLRI